jgi:hypothetical protein
MHEREKVNWLCIAYHDPLFTKEGFMTALRKIPVSCLVLLCLVLLCMGLGLSDIASSSENKNKVIIGNVQRIEGNNYIVKDRKDGKEMRLRVDKTTKMNVVGVTVGDNVMAKVNDQNHVEIIITDPKNQFR